MSVSTSFLRLVRFSSAVVLLFMAIQASGETFSPSLKKATIRVMSGEVMLRGNLSRTERKAALNDLIEDREIIQTGKKSRVEVEFEDKSFCRLGSNTVFSFDPASRDMAVSQGVVVVHVRPGKGGAVIVTPSATAVIRGDTLICSCYRAQDGTRASKFTALSPRGGPMDGSIQITLTKNPNVTFPLNAGQMAVVSQNSNVRSQVPIVEIDVGRFVASSPILQRLPLTAKIEMNVVTINQEKAFALGAARPSDFAVVGLGEMMARRADLSSASAKGAPAIGAAAAAVTTLGAAEAGTVASIPPAEPLTSLKDVLSNERITEFNPPTMPILTPNLPGGDGVPTGNPASMPPEPGILPGDPPN